MITTDPPALAYTGLPAGYEPGYTDRVLQEHHSNEVAQLDQAVATFEAAQQGLLNPAGQRIYAPDEHERRLAGYIRQGGARRRRREGAERPHAYGAQ
jgi:hypothetical protein